MNVKVSNSFFGNIRKINNRILEIGIKYDERFKDKLIGKWIRYWKQLFIDYKEVAIDVKKQCYERPLKAIGISSGFALLWSFAITNPDEVSFRDALLKASNDLILVNPNSQNPSSVEHIKILERSYIRNMIRRQSLLFFSVMWVDNNCNCCNKYDCQCSYLKVSYIQFFKRIIDIGFVNKWWILDKKIEDYDVKF